MKQYLLVEGKDDKYVYDQLCLASKLRLPKGFENQKAYEHRTKGFVKKFDGIDKLLASIEAVLLESGLKRLGIIVDADTNISGRWNAIKARFPNTNIPENPNKDGTVFQYQDKIIGIWLMPNNEETGALESFLKKILPEDDQLMVRAEKIVQTLIDKGIAEFPNNDNAKIKAEVYTYLAWQKTAGLPLGLAVKAEYFDYEKPQAKAFIAWAKRVFEYKEAVKKIQQ